MGILRFSHSSVFSRLAGPVQLMAAWFKPPRHIAGRAGAVVSTHPPQEQPELAFDCDSPLRVKNVASGGSGSCRLKVIRPIDLGVSPGCAGRMVISGRMADVCAELERMARRDTTMH
jgi:hypothetical protein